MTQPAETSPTDTRAPFEGTRPPRTTGPDRPMAIGQIKMGSLK